jgi:hypothetical protein
MRGFSCIHACVRACASTGDRRLKLLSAAADGLVCVTDVGLWCAALHIFRSVSSSRRRPHAWLIDRR